MSRTSSDKELNTEPRTFSVDEILAEYRDLLREEEKPAPATRRSARGASAPASAAEEAPEESIRIYQPHRDRNAAPPSRPAEPVPAPKEAPSPAGEESSRSAPPKDLLARYRLKAKDLAADLAARLRGRGRAKAEPEPGELPSFEELLYGKKEGPVRITEEEESPAPTRPSELPRRKADAQMEIRIPEEELRGLSVSTLPPDSWTGLEDSGRAEGGSSPADEQTRLYSREPRREERKASREPTRLFRQPEPAPSPAPAEEPVFSMSVDDILSEFRAGYTEPAPEPDLPRSRRERTRIREEEQLLPPTDAAPSAAKTRRESASPQALRESGRSSASRASGSGRGRSRRSSQRRRPLQEADAAFAPAPVPERTEPDAPAQDVSPVDASEASSLFGFLRKKPEEAPVPKASPERAAARPAPSPQRRENKNEDVDVSTMSVDDILAEYNDILAAIPAAAEAIGAQRQAEEAAQPAEPAKQAPAPPPSRSRPDGRVSRMQAEAQDFLQQMRSESFGSSGKDEQPRQGGLRRSEQEAAPEKPRIQPVLTEEAADSASLPSLSDAQWSDSLRRILGQDPAPPQPAMEPSAREEDALTPGSRPERRYAIPSDEVDPRFNLGGERKSAMVFGDKELDLSADESYVPPKASEKVGFHWVAGEEDLAQQPIVKKPFLRLGKKEKAPDASQEEPSAEQSEGFDDRRQPQYAPDADYDEGDDDGDPGAFPSFGQYLGSLVSGLLLRVFGAKRTRDDNAGTMEDEDEELGPEVSPAVASKYYGSFVTSLRMRVRIGLVLLVVMTWITLGLPVTGALRSAPVASGMVLAIQLTLMLLGLDVVTGAAVNLARGRFGADSLSVLCCVLTSLDALSVCLGFMGSPHMPLCLISSLSLMGVMLSSLSSARALRKSLRVPAIGKRCYGVTAEADVKGHGLTLLKSLRPPKGFVRRSEEAAPDEELFYRLAPLLGLASLLLALIVAVAKHAFGEYLYILTAVICPAVPVTALLCFALPYLFGSLRIFHSGAAIAGWSGISDIGRSENLIVTDRDLFPEGSVEIDTVRIFAEVKPETVISYAGTMICASGSDLAPCFAQLMEKNNCPMRRVEGFEYLSGGGMKGVVDGSVVLCGGLDLMRLMNVRVPYRLVGKTTVLVAVDGILCGIFNMKYEGQPQVRKALVGLIRSNRHPIFAIRDFLVTPDMLSDCFEVATDGYDFPPYVDRFAISEAKPSEDSKLSAVVCREGLGPLVHMADTGRSMYLSVRINLLITVLAAVLGVAVSFLRLLSAGTVTSGFLLLFLLIWALPVVLISLFLHL